VVEGQTKLGYREHPHVSVCLQQSSTFVLSYIQAFSGNYSQETFFLGRSGGVQLVGWGFQGHLRDLGNQFTLEIENWDILFFGW